MKKVVEFLRENPVQYLATIGRDGKAKCRPFMFAGEMEDVYKRQVVVQSGIGKVNAALCAQILVDVFQVEILINTGIAGSLDAQIDIGDMVISTDAVQHDMDTTIFGDPLGQVPNMDTFSFPADEKLVELACKVNEETNPDIQTFTAVSYTHLDVYKRQVKGCYFVAG